MSRRAPRRLPLAALVLALVATATAPAPLRADDPRDPVTGDPDRFTEFSSHSIALAESALPAGWSLLDPSNEGAEGVAAEAAVRAIASEVGVAADPGFFVQRRSLRAPDGASAHVVLYDVARPAPDLLDALRAAATTRGWLVREAGTARHGIVIAGPEAAREKAWEIQRAFAVHLLRVAAGSALDRGQGLAAVAISRFALAFDPRLPHAHYVIGISAKQLAVLRKPVGDLGPAIAHLEAALAKDAVPPLEPRDRVSATGNLGQALLNKGGADAAARDRLEEAVADVAEVGRTWGVAFRYDLACAHGRLKGLDRAFALLSGVLADLRTEPVEGIDEIWRTDPDFRNLHDDPRWKSLLETYGASAPAK